MASDSKIKLQIMTALDAAGIHATERQVEQMSRTIGRANASASDSSDRLSGAIGKLPGKFGEIGKAMSGVAGKAAMYIGAFTTGYEIGEKIRDQLAALIPAYDNYINIIDKIEKAEKRAQKAADEAWKSYRKASDEMVAAFDAEDKGAERAIRGIERQAAAYLDLAKVRGGIENAVNDAEIQQLERQRFDDVTMLRREGNEEMANQVDHTYDVLKQEIIARKELAAFDRESEQMAIRRAADEEKALARADKTAQKRAQVERIQERIADLDRKSYDEKTDTWNMRAKEYEKQRKALEKQLEKAREAEQVAIDEADAASAGIREKSEAQRQERALRRATLVSQMAMDADRARAVLDDDYAANGNLTGLSFSSDYIQKAYDQSVDSYRVLVELKDEISKQTEIWQSIVPQR